MSNVGHHNGFCADFIRINMSIDSQSSLSELVQRQLTIAVDPEVFKFAVELFQEAASGRMTGSHVPKPDEPALHLTNIPMNRGMLAVVRETRHLDEDTRQALMLLSWPPE